MLKDLTSQIYLLQVKSQSSLKTDPHLSPNIKLNRKSVVSSKRLQEKDKSIILRQKIISNEVC